MKKASILTTTTLAGALLFTGVGANANAAEQVSKSQAEDSVQELVTNNSNYTPKDGTKYTVMDEKYADPHHPENTYSVAFGEEPNQAPSFLYVNKDNGNIYDANGNLVQKASSGSEDNKQQTTDNNATAQNNEQQATDNNVTVQNNEQQATDNNVTAQNNEQQATEKSLPETGETQTNSSLVTIFASVLLAVGSLLTFKRFSNNK